MHKVKIKTIALSACEIATPPEYNGESDNFGFIIKSNKFNKF